MICPECEKEGKRSKVYFGVSGTTCMSAQEFYDEDGKFHRHDPNITSTEYSCSHGHVWGEQHQRKCKTCEEQDGQA